MPPPPDATTPSVGTDAPRVVGRYELVAPIGVGGMATVFVGRLRGDAGFSRVVAVKRLHEHLLGDAEAKAMFIDEARLASQIRHPNVVSTLDVVELGREIFIVMDYVEGVSLSQLLRAVDESGATIPPAMVAAIGSSVMQGLHAAHEAVDRKGEPLGIIHRDVSPHNVMLGSDGIVRVVDFGVAKATGRTHTTRDGKIKGKLAYMAPEQLLGHDVDRRADIFAAGALLWELSTGRRLFQGAHEGEVLHRVLEDTILPPGTLNPRVSPAFDAVVLKALERDPARRFETAEAMAHALEAAAPPVAMRDLATWLRATCAKPLAERAMLVSDARTGVVDGLGLVPQDLTTATGVETGRVTGPMMIATPLRRPVWTAGVIATLCAAALVVVWRVRGTQPVDVAATTRPRAVPTFASGDAAATGPSASSSADPIAVAPPTGTPRIEPSSAPAAPRGPRRATGKGTLPKPATSTTPIYSRD